MRPLLAIIFLFTFQIVRADDSKTWSKISKGVYSGYGDRFARIKEEFVLDNGCTLQAEECEIEVTEQGIEIAEVLFPWDAPGFQASREINGEYKRINIHGKVGSVVLVDLWTERPKGRVVALLRMSLAPDNK